jgi:hypothetical protein
MDRIERIVVFYFRKPEAAAPAKSTDIAARGGNLQPGVNKGMKIFKLYNQQLEQFHTVFAASLEDAVSKVGWAMKDTRRIKNSYKVTTQDKLPDAEVKK